VTQLYLYDDEQARRFEPFALTRPASELRAGAEIIRRRWEIALGRQATGFVGAPHLAMFEEFDAPPFVTADELPAGAIVANARCAPALQLAESHTDVWMCGGEVAAVRLRRPVRLVDLEAGIRPLGSLAPPAAPNAKLRGWWLREVWDSITHLTAMLADDIEHLAPQLVINPQPPLGASIIGAHPVHVEDGAIVEPHVVFDTANGPVLIRAGAHVHAFTRLVGPAFVGRKSAIVGDRLAVVSIGEVCKVRGEMSNTIFLGHANKGHEGFVGHSYAGRWVNMGAGTTTSNLKNTYGAVAFWTPQGLRDTGQQFLGTFLGDHAKTGIGTHLNTGTVLGAGANVYGAVMPPKFVPPFAWGDGEPYDEFDAQKFLKVAERMMARRHVEMSPGMREQLAKAHALAKARRARRTDSGGYVER
jgi:UDP-N-acetylglucosamine diphosphorylase/glucosamine-1-phosphate N-acetyltransferase